MSRYGDGSRGPAGWNHNVHYHRLVLEVVPAGADSALDVGTGDGLLAVDLRDRVPTVVGIDVDSTVLRAAGARSGEISLVEGDVMTHDFHRAFDVVASIATVHHLPDLPAALRRMADLTAPGGVLVVIGLARTTRLGEVAIHLVGQLQHRWFSWRRGFWEHTAPKVWSTPLSYTEVQEIAHRTLAGSTFRRLPMWRYSLIWHKPAHGPS